MKLVAIATLVALLNFVTEVAQAQVSADGALSTQVNSADGRNFVIDGGDRAGNNLFHSFREFSVPTGGAAVFNNAVDVQNIFSRITGGSISNIDGLIQANGRANLFLLNPNGIIFGSNAQLNIGGSFIGSTASRLRFADGTELDTRSPTPLLTLSIPIGLQMGREGGIIQVNGSSNRELVSTPQLGLATLGSTLGLVGNQVTLSGGVVSAIDGRLELGSVTDGTVSLTPTAVGFHFGYDPQSSYGDITLTNRSTLWNPTGESLGGIQIQGRNLRLNDSDIAVAVTPGSTSGGGITLRATESLRLEGNNFRSFPFSSTVSSLVPGDAAGNSGDIQITTPRLEIQDGARIQSVTSGNGSSGNILINADQINLNGYVPINDRTLQQQLLSSQISSATLGVGNSGRIQIESNRLVLRNGGRIYSAVTEQGTGTGGDIQINATRLRAQGGNRLNLASGSSGIYSSTASSGAGGNLRVSGDRIDLRNGGGINSSTFGSGQGGNVHVDAHNALWAGNTLPYYPITSGGVSSSTRSFGDAGDIWVRSPQVHLLGGSDIASYSFVQYLSQPLPGAGEGDAGNIRVQADSIEVVGHSPNLVENTTNLSSVTFGSGDAGNVRLSTNRLKIRDGGVVSSNVLASVLALGAPLPGAGTGRSGNLDINASESIEVIGINPGTRSPSGIGTFTFADGNARNTVVRTPRLTVRGGAVVGTFTSAAGNAGRLTIDARDILVSGRGSNGEPSEINSNARVPNAQSRRSYFLPPFPTGNTGALTINTESLRVEDGGLVTVEHGGTGNAGRLMINADRINVTNNGRITAATASGGGGNVRLHVGDRLLLNQRSTLSATASGMGDGGNLSIDSPFVFAFNNSDIIANAERGMGGDIAITTLGIFGANYRPSLTSQSDITASSKFGVSGSVDIATPNISINSGLIELPDNVDSNPQIAQSCDNQSGSRFVVTGQGGLPETPYQSRVDDRPWNDLRELTWTEPEQATIPAPQLSEATTWQVNETGQVELVAGAIALDSASRATCSPRHD